VELPGIEPGPKIRLNSGNADLPTRNDAKRREMTCGYAEGVDGINIPLSMPQTTPAQSCLAACKPKLRPFATSKSSTANSDALAFAISITCKSPHDEGELWARVNAV
jgi:hypothetical protein